jgi:protein phosphatase
MAEELTDELSRTGMPPGQPSESAPPASAVRDAALDTGLDSGQAAGASSQLRIAVSALSDVGCARTNNEDAFGYDETLGIYVVCDGMGGMASGEVASSHAVAAILNSFAASAASGLPVSTRLLGAINAANLDVWENGQIPENKGMGTTAVVAARDGNKLILGNVGDSRAYILQDGQCVQLTVDHSYVNELIRNGLLTIENAQSANFQGMESVITRAVGVAAEVQPDFYSVDLKPGIGVLLATDGLTRYLVQDGIASILADSTFENACQNLIDMAKQRGGQDNITCILLLALPA